MRKGSHKPTDRGGTPDDSPRAPKITLAGARRQLAETKVSRVRSTKPMSRTKKRALLVEARSLVIQLWPEEVDGAPRGLLSCMFLAVATICLAEKRHRVTLSLQAGTAMWPRITPELFVADPRAASHFGYEWQGPSDRVTAWHAKLGVLPEMHCWVADVERQEIIDPSTATWPEQAELFGFSWETERPPAFFWESYVKLQRKYADHQMGPVYNADDDATLLAHDLAMREVYPRLAQHLHLTLNAGDTDA